MIGSMNTIHNCNIFFYLLGENMCSAQLQLHDNRLIETYFESITSILAGSSSVWELDWQF